MAKPVGYARLIEKYHLKGLPPLRLSSYISPRAMVREKGRFRELERHFIPQYEPEDTLGGQLEFALKYEGLNLPVLIAVLRAAGQENVSAYVRSKSTGKYTRKVWYIHEKILGIPLSEIPDARIGNYVPLLDPEEYITGAGVRSPRHRVEDNLLGSAGLAPMIRRTEKLEQQLKIDYRGQASGLLAQYSPDLLSRAIHFLYTKETKSSFAIEKEVPDRGKSERFIQVLRNSGKKDYLEKRNLVALQNEIVDPRFADQDFRRSQSYVGETLPNFTEKVHYVCPKPEEVPALMGALREVFARGEGAAHPYVLAVAVSFLMVFIHPFEDGNGRIHRFLLHDLLHRMGFTPDEIIFPISATLLRNKRAYDNLLESFSEEVMSVVEYSLDNDGRMTVQGETADLYRFADLTVIAEGMFEMLRETIEKDLAEELRYLSTFEWSMEALKEIVDLPDKDLNLFIKLCLSNNGRLSKAKRDSHFASLTDEEVSALELALRKK